jgi:hypothetical protein
VGPLAAFRSIQRDVYGDIRTAAFGWSWKRVEKGYIWGIIVGITLSYLFLSLVLASVERFPMVIGAGAGSCLALVVVAGPYLKRRSLPGSFLSKIGMENYVLASIRLILSSLVLVILFYCFLTGGLIHKVSITWITVTFLISVAAVMYCGIVGASFSGIKSNVIESTVSPNQGIKLTIRHSLVTGVLVFLIGILLIAVPQFVFEHWRQIDNPNKDAIPYAITLFAVTICFWYGTSVLRHFILRAILYNEGYTPRHFDRFLNYATSLIFLQKVGGGYVFIHRLVMAHFASRAT